MMKRITAIVLCALLLCASAAASANEVQMMRIEWLSNKPYVFFRLGINDVTYPGGVVYPGKPNFRIVKASRFSLGEYGSRKNHDCLVYKTESVGINEINFNGYPLSDFSVWFLPMLVNGEAFENEDSAMLVKGEMRFRTGNCSATFDGLLSKMTSYYGNPDKTVEIIPEPEKREAYAIWYGEGGTYAQIIVNAAETDGNQVVIEFGKTEITDLLPAAVSAKQ